MDIHRWYYYTIWYTKKLRPVLRRFFFRTQTDFVWVIFSNLPIWTHFDMKTYIIHLEIIASSSSSMNECTKRKDVTTQLPAQAKGLS